MRRAAKLCQRALSPLSAVRRCVQYGVRTIEHATLIDADTAAFVASRGAYVVPTMTILFTLVETGREFGFRR